MSLKKALFVLHYSPPIHGASKVGDMIINSSLISSELESKFLKIKGTQRLDEIGKFSLLKIKHSFKLFFGLISKLFLFKPSIIYFTVSPQGFAFYRDLIISIPIKIYCLFKTCSIYYHFHAKGIEEFASKSIISKTLTGLFLKNANLIFISSQMQSEVNSIKGYKKIFFLNNGVNDNLDDSSFRNILKNKNKEINILYLSNMMKEKGYDTVLNLAKKTKFLNQKDIKFHFAGEWSSKSDELYFKNFVEKHKLEEYVEYHGLVSGKDKFNLFVEAKAFIFPSKYKKEVFPLSVLEALSYGLPVIAFNAGAISEIINKEIGVLTDENNLFEVFTIFKQEYLKDTVYIKCRNTFLEKYTIQKFEENLLKILKS